MSGPYTVVASPVVSTVLKGVAGQIVLKGAEIRATPFGKETVQTYEISNGQDDAARAFMDDQLALETCIDAKRKLVGGDNTVIEITRAYDVGDSTWLPGKDAKLWEFEIIDTSQPIMSHPYFGRNSILIDADKAMLMKEMGACDQAVATGKQYKLPDSSRPSSASASDLVKTIMKRYAGLRFSGVDEWNPIMVMLACRYRIFPSQNTTSTAPGTDNTWSTIFANIHQVIDISTYALPAQLTTVVSGIKNWSYSASGSPSPTPNDVGFVWVKMKPQVKLSGRNANGPCDVTDYILGLQLASTVLYPPLNGTLGWDPQYDITGT